MELMKWIYNF